MSVPIAVHARVRGDVARARGELECGEGLPPVLGHLVRVWVRVRVGVRVRVMFRVRVRVSPNPNLLGPWCTAASMSVV